MDIAYFTDESYLYDSLKKRFGELLDVYTEKKPTPALSMIKYCNLHGLKNIKKVSLMSFDIAHSVPYIANIFSDDVKINLYGKYNDKIDNVPKNIKLIKTKEYLTEHINIIEGDNKVFIWYEPYHIRKNGEDYFGFEDEKDELISHRLRPKLYSVDKEKLKKIYDNFKELEDNI